jgi:hypothetical protein
VLTACAQSTANQAILPLLGGAPASVDTQALGKIFREIDDPHTGDRWLLVRDSQLPGGPGRLVRVAGCRERCGDGTAQLTGQPGEAALPPVIHTGDQLVIEEHTERVDALLVARALNPATSGNVLDVRLAIGGKVVRVVALGPGRAVLQAEASVRP